MPKLYDDDIIALFDQFVNSNGLWYKFKAFVQSKGHTVQELGFIDDEDNDTNSDTDGND